MKLSAVIFKGRVSSPEFPPAFARTGKLEVMGYAFCEKPPYMVASRAQGPHSDIVSRVKKQSGERVEILPYPGHVR